MNAQWQVHDYLNFLNELVDSFHASEDVRRGLTPREQGFDLLNNMMFRDLML